MINAAARVLNQATMAERSSDAMVTGQWSKRSLRRATEGRATNLWIWGKEHGLVRPAAHLGRRDNG
jgi:hypothetical protein